MNRFIDIRNAPVKLQFNPNAGPKGTTPRDFDQQHLHLPKTIPTPELHPQQKRFPSDVNKTEVSDYSKLTQELSVLRSQINSIKLENGKLETDHSKEGRCIPGKNGNVDTSLTRQLNPHPTLTKPPGTFIIREVKQSVPDNGQIKTHQQNFLPDRMFHSAGTIKPTQAPTQTQTPTQLTVNHCSQQGKRLDQPLQDKDSLIKALAQRAYNSQCRCKQLQLKIINQSRVIHQLQLLVSEGSSAKEGEFLKLSAQNKRLNEQLESRGDELSRHQIAFTSQAKGYEQVIEKLMATKAQQTLKLQKESPSTQAKSANQQEIPSLRAKVAQLSSLLRTQEDEFSKYKDNNLLNSVSYESVIQTLQQEAQKSTARQNALRENQAIHTSLLSKQQVLIKGFKLEQERTSKYSQRQTIMLKDKQACQRHLVTQQTFIKALNAQISALKRQIYEMAKKEDQTKSLLANRQTLNELVTSKQEVIQALEAEVTKAQKQIGLQKGLVDQRSLHLKTISELEQAVKRLTGHNSDLQKLAAKQKLEFDQRDSFRNIALQREEEVRCLREYIETLQAQISVNSGLRLDSQALTTDTASKDQNRILLKQVETLQALILTYQSRIAALEQQLCPKPTRQFQCDCQLSQKVGTLNQTASRKSKQGTTQKAQRCTECLNLSQSIKAEQSDKIQSLPNTNSGQASKSSHQQQSPNIQLAKEMDDKSREMCNTIHTLQKEIEQLNWKISEQSSMLMDLNNTVLMEGLATLNKELESRRVAG